MRAAASGSVSRTRSRAAGEWAIASRFAYSRAAASPASSRKRTARSVTSASSAGRDAGLRSQRGGAAVVVRQQRHHLVGAVAGPLLDEAPHLEVPAPASRLREHPVGHIADQHVLEGQLPFTRQPALRLGGQDVLLLERAERRGQRQALLLGHRPRASLPRTSCPTTAACCTSRRSNGSSASSLAARTACTESGSSAIPSAPSSPSRRTISSANRGLPPDRSASSGARSLPGTALAAQESRDQLARARGAQRLEEQLRGAESSAAPARATFEQLVPRQADHQQRRAHPACQVLDRVQHPVVGPMDVLEGQDERRALRRRLEHRAQCREERLAPALGVRLRLRQRFGHVQTERAPDLRGAALGHIGPLGAARRWCRQPASPTPHPSCRSPRSRPHRAPPRRAPSRRSPSRRADSARSGCARPARSRAAAAPARAAGATCPPPPPRPA